MSQQEMFVPQAQLAVRTCGHEKRTKGRKGEKITFCKDLVYLHPGVDPAYLTGECRKCGTPKAIRK